MILLLVLWAYASIFLDWRRTAAWDADWAATEPQWTGAPLAAVLAHGSLGGHLFAGQAQDAPAAAGVETVHPVMFLLSHPPPAASF